MIRYCVVDNKNMNAIPFNTYRQALEFYNKFRHKDNFEIKTFVSTKKRKRIDTDE